MQANCDIACFQETKKSYFDMQFLRKTLPPQLNSFCFVPSVGASGGLLVAWKDSLFQGMLKHMNGLSLTMEFTSKLDGSVWYLTNVYGPCNPEGKIEFTNWLKSLNMCVEEDWITLGDFNLYRFPENRNREGRHQ